tara:strand:- start:5053 stop:6165 length:1113 start_codon:yes stop_codon:yes gene_type:complete
MSTFKSDTSFNTKFLIGLFSIIALAASIYLTQHYYSVHFPEGLGGGGICDLSSFFNCDSATNSSVSNIFGAPISSLGIVTSALFLAPLILSKINLSGVVYLFGGINLIGCVGLLIYSLVSLGSLCPVCSIFWVSSNIAFFLSYKNIGTKEIKIIPTIGTSVIFFIVIGLGNLTYSSKQKDLLSIKDDLINQYKELKTIPLPGKLPELNLTSTKDAPIRMVIFSDFQCPACKALSKMIPSIMRRYKNKVEIKYMFYPLDNSCNSKMTYGLHPQACNAARLSLCKKDDLLRVHDEIFHDQATLDDEWIENKVAEEDVKDCYENPETLKELISIVDIGNEIGIKSTPTFLLNEKKIEGALPLSQLYILMDSLL